MVGLATGKTGLAVPARNVRLGNSGEQLFSVVIWQVTAWATPLTEEKSAGPQRSEFLAFGTLLLQ